MVFVFCLALTATFVIARAGKDDVEQASSAPVQPDSPRLSSPKDQQATFVEFLDFECEACGAMYPIVEQLRQTYGDRVSFVVRYFPLPGHFNADRAARAVASAARQNQFEPMYKRMYETQKQWGEQQVPLDDLFTSYARELGLNMTQFASDYTSEAVRAQIDRDIADGRRLGVSGTPTFYLNTTQVPPAGFAELSATFDRVLGQ
ncbi:DsbA family protein [Williamsia herbipolensis]|uniref:DsbA family protein n=1 Tax=Williamsia herbipolensis TaxID=1603258 RepID=UPI0009E3BE47|nr:thioredoxin domain-containing protein [Williamsia herbipolensis]MCX6468286.1 thioredoxin domain-containing protein [Mycobacteriales bacterium]